MGELFKIYRKLLESLGYFLILSKLDLLLLKLLNPKLTIFMYHGVTSTLRQEGIIPNFDGKHVHTNTFDKHMNYLKKRFNILTLSEVVNKIKNGEELPSKTAVLTFDDGYENNYSQTMRIFKKYDIRGTIFLIPESIGNKNPTWPDSIEIMISKTTERNLNLSDFGIDKEYSLNNYSEQSFAIAKLKELCCILEREQLFKFIEYLKNKLNITKLETFNDYTILTAEKIKKMQSNGFDFGSHSLTHATLSAQSEEILLDELKTSKQKLEKLLNLKINNFSYPHGKYNQNVIDCVKKTDYYSAVAVKHGFNKNLNVDNLFTLDRIPISDILTLPLFALNLFIPIEKIDKMLISNYLSAKNLF